MKKAAIFLMTTLFVMVVAGCGTINGPDYTEVKQSGTLATPERKSLVLIYWLDGEGGVKVYANDQMITNLPPSRHAFLSYPANPGQLRISSGVGTGNITKDVFLHGVIVAATGQKAERVAFEVVPGNTYYIRLQHGFAHEEMSLVPEQEAEKEIKDCNWLNPPANSPSIRR